MAVAGEHEGDHVEALTRVGRLDEARLALEKMLTCANHLGLDSEEIGRRASSWGTSPGRSPTWLISAAFNLDKALG